MKGNEIESLSFQIIEKEAGKHGFNEKEWPVVRRMIHTSADFDYIHNTRFHPDAVDAGMAALNRGETIITDTTMALSGIRKEAVSAWGGEVVCLISREGVRKTARTKGVTRAASAVDEAVRVYDRGIYVVGNAPTALMRLLELTARGKASPSLILGFPVGFVNAAESKEALLSVKVPFITSVGRKGGSNIAAAVVNALIIMARQRGLRRTIV